MAGAVDDSTINIVVVIIIIIGRSGLVVARLPAAREDPGSNRAAGKS